MREPVLLALSASLGEGAVALVTPDRVLDARPIGPRETVGARMFPLVRSMLEGHSLAPRDLAAVGGDVGPGSFTGIRMALAAVRAFSWLLDVPAVRVFSTDVLALRVPPDVERFAVCLDARRGMLYAALYSRDEAGDPVRSAGPSLVAADRAGVFAPGAVLVGELPGVTGVPERLLSPGLPEWDPAAFAILAARAFARGETLSWRELLPLYLRKSEAEEKWERENRGSGNA